MNQSSPDRQISITGQKFAMVVEYEGTAYHGWQRQPGHSTIQQVIEEKLDILCGHPVTLYGACRTDAGVHALCQVAHCTVMSPRTTDNLLRGLNALLPEDISVSEVLPVPETFHARHAAREKTYDYLIWNSRFDHPFLRRFAHSVYSPLELGSMGQALSSLEGTHDFSAFRASSCCARSPERTIFRTEIQSQGALIVISLTGNGFLQHMIRIIVGTAILVGRGKITPLEFERILESRDRRQAGPTAPAKGLVLSRLSYHDFDIPAVNRLPNWFNLPKLGASLRLTS